MSAAAQQMGVLWSLGSFVTVSRVRVGRVQTVALTLGPFLGWSLSICVGESV